MLSLGGTDLGPADGAPVLGAEPRFDAVCVELVEAGQREQFFALLEVSHANGTVALLGRNLVLVAFTGLVSIARQLRQDLGLNGLLVVAHEEFVHVVVELLLGHVVHPLVSALLVLAAHKDILKLPNGWSHHVVELLDFLPSTAHLLDAPHVLVRGLGPMHVQVPSFGTKPHLLPLVFIGNLTSERSIDLLLTRRIGCLLSSRAVLRVGKHLRY